MAFYTAHEKLHAAALYQEGYNYSKIGQKMERWPSTIRRWLNPDVYKRSLDYTRKWQQENKKACKEYHDEYMLRNREKVNKRHRAWRASNRSHVRKYFRSPEVRARQKRRRETEPQFKLAAALRTRLYDALKGNFKTGSAVRDLGCSIDELKFYLETLFNTGMTWGNHGSEWHIDHIRPLASFDLTDREQFLEACHYTNLQPLWAELNLKKGAKLI